MKIILTLLMIVLLTSCGSKIQMERQYPKTDYEKQVIADGKLGIKDYFNSLPVLGKKANNEVNTQDNTSNTAQDNANWNILIAKLSSLPLISVDRQSATIITDWHVDSSNSKQKFKLNIIMRQSDMKPSLMINMFKQALDDDVWYDKKFGAVSIGMNKFQSNSLADSVITKNVPNEVKDIILELNQHFSDIQFKY